MEMQPGLVMEEVEHQILADELRHLANEIAGLRRDMDPVLELYRRIEALGWMGRGMLWLAGAVLAIGVAASKLWDILNPPPAKP